MKNKKGAKARKYVQQVKANTKGIQATDAYQRKMASERRAKKRAEAKLRADMGDMLFTSLSSTKKDRRKKNKAKNKAELASGKVNLYHDRRDDKKEDTMDKWDQKKLEDVVSKKHGSENQNNRTDIVCKYFLDAIEKGVYGWFWQCPMGGLKCKYRHCLPPGYVFKTRAQQLAEKQARDAASMVDVCEEIEKERRALPVVSTAL